MAENNEKARQSNSRQQRVKNQVVEKTVPEIEELREKPRQSNPRQQRVRNQAVEKDKSVFSDDTNERVRHSNSRQQRVRNHVVEKDKSVFSDDANDRPRHSNSRQHRVRNQIIENDKSAKPEEEKEPLRSNSRQQRVRNQVVEKEISVPPEGDQNEKPRNSSSRQSRARNQALEKDKPLPPVGPPPNSAPAPSSTSYTPSNTLRGKKAVWRTVPEEFHFPSLSTIPSCPDGVHEVEFIAASTVGFFNDLTLLLRQCLNDLRTKFRKPGEGFPEDFQFLWVDEHTSAVEGVLLSAPSYIQKCIEWINATFDDPKVFPTQTSQNFPGDFIELHVCKIFTLMFRIFAIVHSGAYVLLNDKGMIDSFNATLKHFVFFGIRFNLLVEPNEFLAMKAPMRRLQEEYIKEWQKTKN